MALNALGERLERERAASGLGHTEFAKDVLGIDHGQLSRYINDGVIPGRPTMRLIATGLGVPVAELEALVPERPRGRRATAPIEQTRDLIRATVHETLAQMGHPRVAEVEGVRLIAWAANLLEHGISGLAPARLDELIPDGFRDDLLQVRRRVLVAEGEQPSRTS